MKTKSRNIISLLILGFILLLIPCAEAEHQGTLGTNLTWRISNDGVLTISGQGDMPDHTTPWKEFASEVKSVVIEEGITRIGNMTFSGNYYIKSIAIPDTVVSIGTGAFRMSDITEIMIPSNVKSIGSEVFSYCRNLTAIHVSDENNYYCAPDGVLYDIGKTKLLAYPPMKTDETYSVADSATSISAFAFQGAYYLKNVILPEGVKTIGEWAFSSCNNLESINLPDNLTDLAAGIFRSCNLSKLTLPSSLRRIGAYALDDAGLTELQIPDGVTTIGNSAFYANDITAVDIPESVTSIGEMAFAHCHCLKAVSIPQTTKTIGSDAFAYCPADLMITVFQSSPAEEYVIQNNLPHKVIASYNYTVSGGTVSITKYIGDETNVTIPERISGYPVSSIASGAFTGSSHAREVLIGDHITSIQYGAFPSSGSIRIICCKNSAAHTYANMYGIPYEIIRRIISSGKSENVEWSLDDEGCLVYEGSGPAYSKVSGNYTKVIFEEGITAVGGSLFSQNTNLKEVVISNTVASIGSYSFSGCTGITDIHYMTENGIIGSYAFSGCSGLLNVDLHGVTEIKDYAFESCDKLISIVLGNDLMVIRDCAFKNCKGLNAVSFPETLVEIGYEAFYGTGLQRLFIPGNVKTVGDRAFYGCSMTDAVIAAETVGFASFNNCSKLKNLTLAKGIDTLGSSNFGDCDALVNVTMEDGLSIIGAWAFSGCGALTDVKIPGSVAIIAGSAFESCESLTNVEIEKGVEQIASYAFSNCQNLNGLTIPESVASIGEYAFNLLDSSDEIYLPDQLKEIGKRAFGSARIYTHIGSECAKALGKAGRGFREPGMKLELAYQYSGDELVDLEVTKSDQDIQTVEIPTGVTGIKDGDYSSAGVFYNRTGLVSVIFPDTFRKIGKNAFNNCSGLTKITLPGSVATIGKSAFNNCTGLTEIAFSDSVTTIEESAFNNCRGLMEIVFPESVTTIGENAFAYCTSLSRAVVPKSVTSIGSNAFYSCSNMKSILVGCNSYADQYFTEKGRKVTRVEEMTDPVSGHKWMEPVYTLSDDHLTLTASHVCSLDQTHQESETVEITDITRTKDPTCVIPGETTYTSAVFSNPGFEKQTIVLADIPAPGHTPATAPAVEATCTSTGLTQGSYCSVCGTVLVSQRTVAKKPHALTMVERVASTCTEYGAAAHWKCSVCEKLFTDSNGTTEISSPDQIAATGHAWMSPTYTWAPDNSTVTGTRVCSRDSDHIETETVTVSRTIYSPTERRAGSYIYVSESFQNPAFSVQQRNGNLPMIGSMDVLLLPDSLQEIHEEAFTKQACEAVIVPRGCKVIGKRAFADCPHLFYAMIPEDAQVAEDAFDGCNNVIVDYRNYDLPILTPTPEPTPIPTPTPTPGPTYKTLYLGTYATIRVSSTFYLKKAETLSGNRFKHTYEDTDRHGLEFIRKQMPFTMLVTELSQANFYQLEAALRQAWGSDMEVRTINGIGVFYHEKTTYQSGFSYKTISLAFLGKNQTPIRIDFVDVYNVEESMVDSIIYSIQVPR